MKKEESKFFIEVTESGAGQKASTEWPTSKSFAEKTPELTEEKLKMLWGIIPRLTELVFEGIQSTVKKPTEVDMAFSVGMTVDGRIISV